MINSVRYQFGHIKCVSAAKRLGIKLDANILWSSHVEAVLSKTIFLKQLRRAGVPLAQLVHFYIAVIRPVLEYTAPVCYHLLTKTHSDQLEAI